MVNTVVVKSGGALPKKYAKKVLTVDALQFTGELNQNFRAFLQQDLFITDTGINIVCTGGLTRPVVGDWIVRDENGVVSVLHPNSFKERYAEILE